MKSHKRSATLSLAPMWAAFDPRLAPVLGIDEHLDPVPAERLTPAALRQRFQSPVEWIPEHSTETSFSDRTPAPASVLIPLIMRSEMMLLLTQRADTLSTHSGQIAFPGGRVDKSDLDAVDTALREANEEIGLPQRDVEVLGTLPIYVTGTAFIITPVVALVRPSAPLTPNPGEVADIFEVPLRYLMNPANHRRHEAVLGGVGRRWLSMPYLDETRHADGAGTQERFIWGATAGMLRNLYRFLSA